MHPLVRIARRLCRRVTPLRFEPPVAYVYNPLDYASALHEQYLERFGDPPKEAVLVGMNPGPWGMAQTGVPFGEVEAVKHWLDIDGTVKQPERMHPKRPVQGLQCPRREVSGQRLWGWARERFGTPDAFFSRFFVHNYCPLVFMEEGARNRTPDKLPANERDALFAACDDALRDTVEALRPRWVVGVGAFAHKRIRHALSEGHFETGVILHPSPASPKANRGWAREAEAQLRALGISLP